MLSFPKAERFYVRPPSTNYSPINLPPVLKANNKITFGSSAKSNFLKNLPSFDTPAPGAYEIANALDFGSILHSKESKNLNVSKSSQIINKGISFGIGYNDNVYIQDNPIPPMRAVAEIPGPGTYSINCLKEIGKTGQKISLKGKLPSSFIRIKDVPAPCEYALNFNAVDPGAYKNLSFGAGDRPNAFVAPRIFLKFVNH